MKKITLLTVTIALVAVLLGISSVTVKAADRKECVQQLVTHIQEKGTPDSKGRPVIEVNASDKTRYGLIYESSENRISMIYLSSLGNVFLFYRINDEGKDEFKYQLADGPIYYAFIDRKTYDAKKVFYIYDESTFKAANGVETAVALTALHSGMKVWDEYLTKNL